MNIITRCDHRSIDLSVKYWLVFVSITPHLPPYPTSPRWTCCKPNMKIISQAPSYTIRNIRAIGPLQ